MQEDRDSFPDLSLMEYPVAERLPIRESSLEEIEPPVHYSVDSISERWVSLASILDL